MKLIASFDLRRRLFLLLVAGTGTVGLVGLFQALALAGVDTAARVPLALLFAMTFTWIAVSFWHAVIGFVLMLMQRDPCSLKPLALFDRDDQTLQPHRTALVMPIHNEDPAAVRAGLAAMAALLLESGKSGGFEFFVLSDTQDVDLLSAEQSHLAALQKELDGRMSLHYRHRPDNAGRKAGNLADFCRRWGRNFEFMLVLDADSRMDAVSMVRLVSRMQAEPDLGLIQTLPIPAGQGSLFARVMQFASSLYSPMLATGQAFWQGPVGNYWGHNALIRVSAFMSSCGLPRLSGKPPLGGEILSHDFVEAALMARAGWSVVLETSVLSSHEEMPANLIDFLARDRRWMQGNLQHLRLLHMTGLRPASRLHFLFGAFAYLSSLAWLGLIVMGLATLIAQPQVTELANPGLSAWNLAMLIATLVVLFAPRVLGVLLAMLQRPDAFGGRLRILASSVTEAVAGILLAPVMMLFHARFALEIVSGSSAGWSSPPRGERGVGGSEALSRTAFVALLGLAWLILAVTLTPQYLWWMSPVWLGLLLSPVMVWASGSVRWGRALFEAGLLLTPQEVFPTVLLQKGAPVSVSGSELARLSPPPPEYPGEMPDQPIRCEYLARQQSLLGRSRA